MSAKTIMVQGTASDVGKSVLATALCRLLRRRGLRVAPFKAQNMSNNSYVTKEGGEIGRAQGVQAMACGIEPTVAMNPILLKPNSDKTSQIIVMGKVFESLGAEDYYRKREVFARYIHEALDGLRKDYDVIVIEGAGSPAEINIKDDDIVNMSVAKAADAAVILVGDIDKGGIFAQIVGTFDLLEEEEKNLIKAFCINKFRGDKNILQPGVRWIENKIERKCLGVLPMIPSLDIEQEDAVVLDRATNAGHRFSSNKLLVHVIRLPRISNFTDFDSLKMEKDVHLEFIERPSRHVIPDLLIIPGTKSTVGDLEFLKTKGFVPHIQRCLNAGSSVLGICGGYQMLGHTIEDPDGAESKIKVTQGLRLLPMNTVFSSKKTTTRVNALHAKSRLPVSGYEIHMGQTRFFEQIDPFFEITGRAGEAVHDYDGACLKANARDGSIFGTYIHGLFDEKNFRRAFLNQIRVQSGLKIGSSHGQDDDNSRDAAFDRLADEFEKHMDISVLNDILEGQLKKAVAA